MKTRTVAIAWFVALTGVALAQQPAASSLEKRWPGEPSATPDSAAPSQKPSGGSRAKAAPQAQDAAPAIKSQPAPARVVACSGVFAKDSSHIKLATFFGSDAITWAKVDGPDGTKLDATVLYPRDPKRRLEVLWNLEGSRSDTQLIVINGQSTWTAPKGLKLGLPLAALEKLNGKPFNMRAFGGDNSGQVTSWENGALASLPGGCKVGIRLVPDPKAPPQAAADVSGDKEILSSFPALRTLSPKVSEIIVGY
jgi:hypothetical protein